MVPTYYLYLIGEPEIERKIVELIGTGGYCQAVKISNDQISKSKSPLITYLESADWFLSNIILWAVDIKFVFNFFEVIYLLIY